MSEKNIKPEVYLPKNVLVVVAHADDIDFGVAGSVAHWVQHGATVTYCIVTDNSAGSNDPDADLQDLIDLRQQEQTEAAKLVGVTDIRWLHYRDGDLTPSIDLRRDITRVIRQVRPDRVVTFDPSLMFSERPGNVYINHPDHRAVGEATLYAVFPSAETRPIFRELLDEGLEPHKVTDLYLVLTEKINTFVNITYQIDKKVAALACHKSQLDGEVVNMVKGWNAEAGKKFMGGGFAEVFRVLPLNREEG